jgi:hypothetical protein
MENIMWMERHHNPSSGEHVCGEHVCGRIILSMQLKMFSCYPTTIN